MKFYISRLEDEKGNPNKPIHIGCAPALASAPGQPGIGSTITFKGSGTQKLFFEGSNPLTDNGNTLDATCLIEWDKAYGVTSVPGVYYFRLEDPAQNPGAMRFQIAVANSGETSPAIVYKVVSATDLRVCLSGQPSGAYIEVDLVEEGDLSQYKVERTIGPSNSNPQDRDLKNGSPQATDRWDLPVPAEKQVWHFRIKPIQGSLPAGVPGFEALGGAEGEGDVDPPPPPP